MSKFKRVGCYKGKERRKPFTFSFLPTLGYKEIFSFGDNRYIEIACNDAREYTKSLSCQIQLVFTSPPYNCDMPYEGFVDKMPWEEYETLLVETFQACWEKMVPGARAIVVFPTLITLGRQRYIPLSFFEKVMKKAGFEIGDLAVWVKAKSLKELKGVAGRSTAWGSYLSPSSPFLRPVTEFILITRKQGTFLNAEKGSLSKEEFKEATISAWMVPCRSSRHHPATFPVELVSKAIKLYTFPGQTVLDPFMGLGNTAIACFQSGRNFCGCDISPFYVEKAVKGVLHEIKKFQSESSSSKNYS